MRIFSPLLKKVFYPALSRAGVFHRTSAQGLAVVTYHGVLPQGYESIDSAFDGNLISAEVLGLQLRLLKAYYNVISADDSLAWHERGRELPPRAVLLTCDDGLLNCLSDMLPVLRQEEVSCLFFVTGASTEESRTMPWYNLASLRGLEKAGFQRRYPLVRQRLLGWQRINGETPKLDQAPVAEVSARV